MALSICNFLLKAVFVAFMYVSRAQDLTSKWFPLSKQAMQELELAWNLTLKWFLLSKQAMQELELEFKCVQFCI